MNVFMPRTDATAGMILFLLTLSLSTCVPAQQYDALQNDYNQLNQQPDQHLEQL